jgi:HEAT repeat protein
VREIRKPEEVMVDVAAAGVRGLLGAFEAGIRAIVGPSRRQATAWREAARVAGLAAVEESRDGLAGWAGPLRVRLERYADKDSRGTRITISGPAMPAGLTVRPEGVLSLIRGARGVREVEIGHDTFDAAAWVEGSPALARAVLDAGTRQSLRALFEGRLHRAGHSPLFASGRVEDGVLRVDVLEAPPRAPGFGESRDPGGEPGAYVYLSGLEHLGEALAPTIALARRLATPADVPRRLAENMKSEPVAGVRVAVLATLLREFPDHPATREVLVAAREDPDAEVRLRDGIALGPEGRDVLLALAGGEGAPDETTQRAVAALGGRLTTPEAEAILRNALRTRRHGTARACLSLLGQRRGAQVVTMLVKVLAVETPELAAAAADALGATGERAAGRALRAALDSPDAGVRVAAARALGRVGTAAAVGRLREAESGDSALRRAARQAIAAIQARLAGAAPGQLSLAGGEAGQLSIVEGEHGQLSLAPSSRGASTASGDEGSAVTPADPPGHGQGQQTADCGQQGIPRDRAGRAIPRVTE